jgi:copper homeostasis protein
MQPILEICTFNLASAIAAQNAGADRIELCQNQHNGGTTPSYGMLKQARHLLTIPFFPIIRPRGGNFTYSAAEIAEMKYDIEVCKNLDIEGVVLGVLNNNSEVDIATTTALVRLADTMEVTFHRAFDRTRNVLDSLKKIIDTGCKRLLTSGLQVSATNGMHQLEQLLSYAEGKIIIMPGGGIRSYNIADFKAIGFNEFHSSALTYTSNVENFNNIFPAEDLAYDFVNETEIKAMKSIINN